LEQDVLIGVKRSDATAFYEPTP